MKIPGKTKSEEKLSTLTGMLAIGYGEKCPYCDTVIDKDTNVILHMRYNHKDEMMKALFETDDEE